MSVFWQCLVWFSFPFHIAGWRMDGWWQKWFSGWLAHGHVRGTAPPGNAIYCQHASAGTAVLLCNGVKPSHCAQYSNIELDWNALSVLNDDQGKRTCCKTKTLHDYPRTSSGGPKCFQMFPFFILPFTTTWSQFLEICHSGCGPKRNTS